MDRFPDKRVVITGGASGLGRSLSHCFASRGWRIAVTDIDKAGAEQTLAGVKHRGGGGFVFGCDVTQLDDFHALEEELKNRWGGVDVVINNAGIFCRKPVLALEVGDWQRVLDVNLLGVVRSCRTLAALLVRQKRGQVVNIASSTGLLPPSRQSAYSASKAGVIALSETLAQELAPFNIGVTVVCPSYFESNLHERVINDFTSDDLANVIYGAVESNEFMVIPHERVRRAWQDKVRVQH